MVYKVSTPCSITPDPVGNGPITLSGTARGAAFRNHVTAGKTVKVSFALTRAPDTAARKALKKADQVWEDYAVTLGLPANVTVKGTPKVFPARGLKKPTSADAATVVWEEVPLRVNGGRKAKAYKRVFSFLATVDKDYVGDLEFTATAFNAVEGYYREAAFVVRLPFVLSIGDNSCPQSTNPPRTLYNPTKTQGDGGGPQVNEMEKGLERKGKFHFSFSAFPFPFSSLPSPKRLATR